MIKNLRLVVVLFIISFLTGQDFSKIDIDLDNLAFQKTIIPLQEFNNTFPKNIDVLSRLSAAHHFYQNKLMTKK